MSFVMKVVDGPALAHPHALYLASFDLEANEGRGEFVLTAFLEEAMRFENVGEATATWNGQSVTVPVRHNGKPNRPLTALTVDIMELSSIRNDRH